uniref:Uncharacterized protein n=1 Tax=virus sp. ctmTa7 TaxID=2828255 RepID=A0A8S5RCJ3_9VIRU|nr:MAG TPA: hypothetical protein [virus sp. ctmTa7]
MTEETILEYKISDHAQKRYAERIIGKDNQVEINRFVTENKDKIKTDINKMIQYGEMIYAGIQSQKDNKGKVINVFLKDCWVVLVNIQTHIVVTLYKIDLGCGDEFNQIYVSKMLNKLNEKKKLLAETKFNVAKESEEYKNLISDAQSQINEYKSMVKNLESMCIGYQTIIDNNTVKIKQADREVADIVNTLINKKEF